MLTSSNVAWKLGLALMISKYLRSVANLSLWYTSHAFFPSPSLYAPISFFNATSSLARKGAIAASAIVKSSETAYV